MLQICPSILILFVSVNTFYEASKCSNTIGVVLFIQMVDLLHPLTTIHWEEWIQSLSLLAERCVLLKGRLYLNTKNGSLHMCDPNIDSMAELKTPSKGLYGISIYRSQLVLVGGLDPTTKQMTNKVWTSDDGCKWEATLPPLPTACENPLVVNTGIPEYLLVIGGRIEGDCIEVNVLMGERWIPVHSMPLISMGRQWRSTQHDTNFLAHTIHNWNLFVLRGHSPSLYCNLHSLLATAPFKKSSGYSVWRTFKVPSDYSLFLSFGNTVVAAGNIDQHALGPRFYGCGCCGRNRLTMIQRSPKICAYSPYTRTWVHVGDIPRSYQHHFTTFGGNSGFVISQLREIRNPASDEKSLKVLLVRLENGQQKAIKASWKSKRTHPF